MGQQGESENKLVMFLTPAQQDAIRKTLGIADPVDRIELMLTADEVRRLDRRYEESDSQMMLYASPGFFPWERK